jgi:hypothetical protein
LALKEYLAVAVSNHLERLAYLDPELLEMFLFDPESLTSFRVVARVAIVVMTCRVILNDQRVV